MTYRLLVVEDNIVLAEGLRLNLGAEGYDVRVAHDGGSGLSLARRWAPHLLVLDLALPTLDGLTLLDSLRSEGDDVPALILSARGTEGDRVRGFRAGADDYVVKPFSLAELLARVAAMLRRSRAPRARRGVGRTWTFDDVEVLEGAREVRRSGVPVEVRPREFDLLVALLRRMGEVVSRRELLDEVWGYDAGVHSRTMDVHMVELRRKLERDPARPTRLLTVRKAGYRLAVDGVATREGPLAS